MSVRPRPIGHLALYLSLLLAARCAALTLENQKATYATLPATTVSLTGRSELHLTGAGDPIPGTTIDLGSEDCWVFLHAVPPSAATANLVPRIRVNGTAAVAGTNLRVVQHLAGSVLIPQAPDFAAVRLYTGSHLGGESTSISPYQTSALGRFDDAARSIVIKRGYTATFAEHADGSGASRNYVAQDADLELSLLPAELDGTISFVRVFPWRWASKKGSCDVSPTTLQATWHYNWNISLNSAPGWEYVAIKQQPYWPGLNQDWRARGVSHLSGFNEPDNPVEDAYQNLTPPGSSADAAARWPELLATGLRVGAPAITDGGTAWITDFMNRADAAGHRVDYVPVHYYRSHSTNDPAGAANQLRSFLQSIHNIVQRPLWVTEFNNGANWTDNAHDPSTGQNRDVVEAMIEMMDGLDWVERYAIYSDVEWFRRTHYDDGSFTPMGAMYRDHRAPMAHRQAVPDPARFPDAEFLFENHSRDTVGGNNALASGLPAYVAGQRGSAISFDGEDDFLALPAHLGDRADFTFAAWVRWDGGANWQRIFDFGDGTDDFLFLSPNGASNALRFAIRQGGGDEQRLNGPALPVGQWTHLAVTLSGDTGKLFVNGSVVDTQTITLDPAGIGTTANYLGKSQFADPLFRGALDEVRVFGTALDDARVAALMTATPPQLDPAPASLAATIDQAFTADLTGLVLDGSPPFRFEKLSGPAWLSLSREGSLFGVPGLADLGRGSLMLRVSDAIGLSALASIPLEVDGPDHVAHFPFDSGSDNALGRDPATPVGGPVNGSGQRALSLVFDGSDDHVLLPPGLTRTDECTIAAWVRWNGGANWQRVFDFGRGQDAYLFLTPSSGGNTLRFAIKNGGAEQILETSALTPGVWRHLAVTLAPGEARLYVDGQVVDAGSHVTLRPSDLAADTLYLGRSQFPDPYFQGSIDEFHLFHRALGSAEIEALRNQATPHYDPNPLALPGLTAGEPLDTRVGATADGLQYEKVAGPAWLQVESDGRIHGTPSAADAGSPPFRIRASHAGVPSADLVLQVPVSAPPGTLLHYEFDGSPHDSTGGYHATASGSPGYAAGLFDQAVTLDGIGAHLALPAGFLDGTTDLTIAARIRPESDATWQRVFDFGNGTANNLFLTTRTPSDTLRFAIKQNNGSEQRLNAPLPPLGEWSHIAVTLQGDLGTLYLNGAAIDQQTITLDPADLGTFTTNYLGRSQYASDPAFAGRLDDFRILDHALDAAAIRALAMPPAPAATDGYPAWAASHPFPAGSEGPEDDPDQDRLANLLEWLFGSDPLDPSGNEFLQAAVLAGSELGLDDDAHYLTLQARLRKTRPGVTPAPESAATLDDLATEETRDAMVPVGVAVDDGEFEFLTWRSPQPVSASATGFARLRVQLDP